MSESGKQRLGLIFGGRSSEHEVSMTSARSVLKALDMDRFEVELICIKPDGRWIIGERAKNLLEGADTGNAEEVFVPQNPNERQFVSLSGRKDSERVSRLKEFDVVFPLLHGTFGEDGTIQGLFELAGIPYVGAGVAASAVCMDKIMMKDILISRGIPVGPYVFLLRKEWENGRDKIAEKLKELFGFPIFVKPANAGSSVGITKVHNEDEIRDAVDLAAQYDRKILIEKGLDAREIEISVLGNDDPQVSVPGEIIPSREFYDYEAKYIDESSELIIPADLTEGITKEISEIAAKAFKSVDCAGMARIDFFIERDSNAVFLNELNTIPGFTPISMYPKLWEVSGVSYSYLISRLIDLAFERFTDKKRSKTTYKD